MAKRERSKTAATTASPGSADATTTSGGRALTPWQRALLASLAGCCVFLATATFDIWPLAWVAFVPLFFAIRDCTPRQAFLLAWLCGFVTNFGGFYWIPHLLMRFGKLNWAVSWLLFSLLAAYQGLHFGVAAWAIQRVRRRFALPMTLLAPIYLVTAELFMPFIFDWYLAITQAWVVPVIQIADLGGPLAVTALLMVVNGAIFDTSQSLLARRGVPWKPVLAAVGILAAALIYGQIRIAQVESTRAAAEKVKVGIVQANIGITQKGRARLAMKHHLIHLRESHKLQKAGAELLIWPESSYPWALSRERTRDYDGRDPRQIMRGIKVPLIFGAITYGAKERYPFNTALMVAKDGRFVGRFDKNYLLVFGEYIPLYDKLPRFKKWFPAASHFNHGTEVTTFPFRGKRIGPMICYEDLMPSFTRRLAKLRPNLLVNVTNDAWFGATSEPYEHMALAVYRAVELRLDLLRSVNTGPTSLIDATGRVRSITGAHDPVIEPGVKPETLLDEVALMPGSKTVYTEIGDILGYSAVGAALFLLVLLPRLRRQKGTPPAAAATPAKAAETAKPAPTQAASRGRGKGGKPARKRKRRR